MCVAACVGMPSSLSERAASRDDTQSAEATVVSSRANGKVGVNRGDSQLPALTCALVSLMACQKAKADTRRASPLCAALFELPTAQSPVASKNQFTVAHISWDTQSGVHTVAHISWDTQSGVHTVAHISWDTQSGLYVPQSEVYSGTLHGTYGRRPPML